MRETCDEARFIVDAMLGNITTWLRILGYDSIYWNGGDKELIEKAVKEGRIIITKDRELASSALRRGVRVALVDGSDVPRIIAEISRRYRLNVVFNPRRTRCPKCNSPLTLIEGEEFRWTCPGCGKEYWVGGHWRNISVVLGEVRRLAGELRDR